MKYRLFSYLLIAFVAVSALFAQDLPKISIKNMSDKIPSDPAIKIGTLSNGMKYYIKKNAKPEKRAELYLVVKAGSIDEDDDQKGLAHFTEHMAFNGTKSFPKNELVNFLERTGVRFGADINASTGFDRTMYTLQVPTDTAHLLDKGLTILKEWASDITFEKEEIEKERGVIVEEWRVRTSADTRAFLKHIPLMAYGSKYSDRFPIGDTGIIKTAPQSAFLRFYKDWYRPNQMAVIAVGDFDPVKIEQMIKDKFSVIKNPATERPRPEYKLQDHQDLKVSVYTDKELRMPSIQLVHKFNKTEGGTYAEYMQNSINSLASSVLSMRLQELQQKPDAAFLRAFGGINGGFMGDKGAFTLMVIPKTGKIREAFQQVLAEYNRILQNGVTAPEIERTKQNILASLESYYNERDKMESSSLASEFSRNFVDDEAIPGIAYELALNKEMMPKITAADVNKVFEMTKGEANTVIALSAPTSEQNIPSEDELKSMFRNAAGATLEAYVDKTSDKPLMASKPAPGKIVSETKNDKLGTIEYTLSNGAKVIVKKTDFKDNEILFTALSPGGYSLAEDKIFMSARSADDIVLESGIGEFDNIQLDRKLTGIVASVGPYMAELQEGLRGSSSINDIETLFQLTHLYFTSPRMDKDAFTRYTQELNESIVNKTRDPRSVLRDTMDAVLANYNRKGMPLSADMINEISQKSALTYYSHAFSDADDFRFYFVGSVDEAKLKPLIETYIASLPSKPSKETWKDLGLRKPEGPVRKEVYKGIDPQSMVYLFSMGKMNYTAKDRYVLSSLEEALRIRVREVLREDQGGVYSPGVFSSNNKFPNPEYSVGVVFGTDPKRVDELIGYVKDLFVEFKSKPVSDDILKKVKEIQKRAHEVRLKNNSFWLSTLSNYDFLGEDINAVMNYPAMIESLTAKDIQEAAKKYLDEKNLKQFILFPEEAKK